MKDEAARPNPEEVMKELEACRLCAEAIAPLPLGIQRRVIKWLAEVFYESQLMSIEALANDYKALREQVEESRQRIEAAIEAESAKNET